MTRDGRPHSSADPIAARTHGRPDAVEKTNNRLMEDRKAMADAKAMADLENNPHERPDGISKHPHYVGGRIYGVPTEICVSSDTAPSGGGQPTM